MFRSRLFWKLYLGFASLIVITTVVAGWIESSRVEEAAREEVRRSLVDWAGLVAGALEGTLPGDPRQIQEKVARLCAGGSTRITIIAEDGRVLGDSHEDPLVMDHHDDRPEVAAARESGRPAVSVRLSTTLGMDMMYLALPIRSGTDFTGYVRASLPLTSVRERLTELRLNVAIAAAIAAVLSLFLGIFLFRSLTKPLRGMARSAEAVAAGDYGVRIRIASRDEVGRLGDSIQRMSDQLRERLETQTRERNRLQAILGSMLEGVVAVDRGEKVVHINDVAAALLRTTIEESLGLGIRELIQVRGVGDLLADVLEGKAALAREVQLPKALRERVIELHASPLKDDRGAIFGAVLVLHDVSRLRRLESVRREFVANVSHELKTPLTAIRGYAETLIDDTEIDPALRERFLSRIQSQTLRLSSLVKDLLVLSRVESEEEALDRRAMDLRAPLEESSRRFILDAEERGLTFEMDLPADPVPVTGDEEALRQVVDNLLDNAFKYTSDGGRVVLSVGASGDRAVVEISDTGLGIPEKHLSRIFERFYRVDKARSRELGGTGLGLAIVKHIVEAHDGTLEVQSVAGEGSCFRVSIPLGETA